MSRPVASHRRFVPAKWAAVAAFLLALALGVTAPRSMGRLPEGMQMPILAFELVRSRTEVEQMFASSDAELRATWIAAIDRTNLLDYPFMLAYGAFLLLFARAVLPPGRRSKLAGGLAVIAALADAVENLCLLRITAQLGQDYDGTLRVLAFATWIKWFAIASACTSWYPGLRNRGLPGLLLRVLGPASLLFTTAALFARGLSAELMLHSVGSCLFVAFAYSFWETRRARAASRVRS